MKTIDMLPPDCRSLKKPCELCATVYGTPFYGTSTELRTVKCEVLFKQNVCHVVVEVGSKESKSVTSPHKGYQQMASMSFDAEKNHICEFVKSKLM